MQRDIVKMSEIQRDLQGNLHTLQLRDNNRYQEQSLMERLKGIEMVEIPNAVIKELADLKIELSGLREKDKSLSKISHELESELKLFKID